MTATERYNATLLAHESEVLALYAQHRSMERVRWLLRRAGYPHIPYWVLKGFLEARGVELINLRSIDMVAKTRRDTVVSLRGTGATFAEIGRQLGVSKERARQLHNRAVSQ